MESEPNELGAVAVDGTVKYELLEHDAHHVKLRNILEPEQYLVIELEALPGLASILNKAAKEFGIN